MKVFTENILLAQIADKYLMTRKITSKKDNYLYKLKISYENVQFSKNIIL